MNKPLFAKLAAIAAISAMGAFAATANAATATANFQVKMTITSACNISTAPTDISLGTFVASTTAITTGASNTFKVTCSKGTPFYIGMLPSSANSGTSLGTGNMVSTTAPTVNTDKVPYTLYSNAGLTTVWGNTATTTSVGNGVAGTGLGMATVNAVSFTAYAQATSSNFTPDSYADTVTMTVNY